jgi:3',5'-cyclic AMP phosphodiesterase CpdA
VRIFFTSDLHVDAGANGRFAEELAELAASDRPDVLILAGDLCNGVGRLPQVLRLFAKAAPVRLYVPGNHELWAAGPGESPARERYYREIPGIARDAGFHPLVTESLVAADVGFAGTMSWYDYTFADAADGFTEAELESKTRDGVEWMDRRFVSWTAGDGRRLKDREVTDLLLEDLRDQLAALAAAPLRAIVVVTHHIAFRDLVPRVFVDGHLRFFRAFLGSERVGAAIAADGRVVLALAGHVHSVRTARVGRLTAMTCPVGYPRERPPAEPPSARRLLLDV